MIAKLKCVQACQGDANPARVQLYYDGQKLCNEATLAAAGYVRVLYASVPMLNTPNSCVPRPEYCCLGVMGRT